ncbi:MAG: HAMP domain-containing protein, partial [Gammaproteobacteria bacterium]|nr:HAMP domain-containing protein [Gammaproteobacteria bacterium]
MQFRHSLRFRILFSYLIFGISFGVVMAVFHYLSLDELEEILIYEQVTDEMHLFVNLTDKDKNITRLHTKKITAFKKTPGEVIVSFPFLSSLSPGFHEKYFNKHTYTILINEKENFRYYVLYDETDFAAREDFLLITLSISIALAILFALWFGYWISGKIISPIRYLANQVGQLQTGQLEIKLSTEYADDEVGQLAETFDEFMHKLVLFVERERSFTAAASHELRTPLA